MRHLSAAKITALSHSFCMAQPIVMHYCFFVCTPGQEQQLKGAYTKQIVSKFQQYLRDNPADDSFEADAIAQVPNFLQLIAKALVKLNMPSLVSNLAAASSSSSLSHNSHTEKTVSASSINNKKAKKAMLV